MFVLCLKLNNENKTLSWQVFIVACFLSLFLIWRSLNFLFLSSKRHPNDNHSLNNNQLVQTFSLSLLSRAKTKQNNNKNCSPKKKSEENLELKKAAAKNIVALIWVKSTVLRTFFNKAINMKRRHKNNSVIFGNFVQLFALTVL